MIRKFAFVQPHDVTRLESNNKDHANLDSEQIGGNTLELFLNPDWLSSLVDSVVEEPSEAF